MHPDQLYQLRQLQHQDYRTAAEQARVRRTILDTRMASGCAWLMTRLHSTRKRQIHIAEVQ
jgi:hypothetical protein